MEDDFLEMQYEDQHGYPDDDLGNMNDEFLYQDDEDIKQCFNCDAPTSNFYCSICTHSEGVY